jgi:hypothetical protein
VNADFATLLAAAKLPEKTVPVCLRGDLAAEHEAAERDLKQAERRNGDSLAGSGVGDLVDRIEELESQMAENQYLFRFRAMPRPEFRAIVAAHPPRRDPGTNDIVDADRFLLVNAETFFDALIRRCLVDPQLTDDEWVRTVSTLTDHQYNELGSAAWDLNRAEVDIPFSLAASRLRQGSGDE